MSAEREIPLNYQLTVTNVLTIGSKSMADFFVAFATSSGRQWKSPVVHGRVTRDNTRFPWTFSVDRQQLTVSFFEIDQKNGRELLVGSTPLLLLKREGEEEFLVFGCTEANRGRKVAEVEFTYLQCSNAKSLSSHKRSEASNEESKRLSLEYTIEVDNYDARKGLNIIPEEPEARESQPNSKLPIDSGESLLEQDFHPSKLETLKAETNRNKAVSEESNFQLNLIREMEDPADRWYRNNFGREKPSNLDNYEFDIDNSRTATLLYEKSYEYLNELAFPEPHLEIRNIIIHSEKKPRAIELFSIDMDGSQLVKDKIAAMHAQGTKYEWPNAVRLPREKKAYGIEITTEDKEKLQGLILKDAHHAKSSLEIYNRKGLKVGKVNYSLKEIKKIEVQTLEIMEMQPVPEEEESNELDKSFLKSAVPKTEAKGESLLHSCSRFTAEEGRNKLIKEIYLNREREREAEELPRQPSLPVPNQRLHEYAQRQPQVQRTMTNQAYLGREVFQSPLKKNPRKNQYVPVAQPPSAQSSLPKSTAKAASPFLQESPIRQATPSQTPQSNSHETSQQANEFLPSDNSYENQELTEVRIADEAPQGSQLNKKIEELKRIGTDLGKKAKAFPQKKFTKNAKYKTVIYQQEQGIDYEQKRSLENSDSGKQEQSHKKAYRQPINATPSFQSLLINNTFSKEEDSRAKVPTATKPPEQRPAEEPNRTAISHRNISQANQISDDSQEVPITRHKTADQNLLKEMIQQKEADILSKRQESLRAQSVIPEQSEPERRGQSYGVNTERMSINNVMQTSFVPTTPTQKRASPLLEELKSIDYEASEGWEQKRSSKEEVASVRDSVIDHSHHTKYSSQTIQPATQLATGKLNYQITSISVSHFESAFGNKFLKVYIPNKHYYETPPISHPSSLLWKCHGFLFSNVHESQDLYLQLYSSAGGEQKMLGRVILSSREFHPQAEQSLLRACLVLESKAVGEVVIGYHSFGKSRQRGNWQAEREPSKQREAVSESRYNQSKKEATPVKRRRKKRSPSDSLTKFLRRNRKEKLNRYIVNEYSRAHIESRINPLQPRKYTGKSITIGRDIRFPFGPEDEHKVLTPGPGAYRQRSDFQRYQLQK